MRDITNHSSTSQQHTMSSPAAWVPRVRHVVGACTFRRLAGIGSPHKQQDGESRPESRCQLAAAGDRAGNVSAGSVFIGDTARRSTSSRKCVNCGSTLLAAGAAGSNVGLNRPSCLQLRASIPGGRCVCVCVLRSASLSEYLLFSPIPTRTSLPPSFLSSSSIFIHSSTRLSLSLSIPLLIVSQSSSHPTHRETLSSPIPPRAAKQILAAGAGSELPSQEL